MKWWPWGRTERRESSYTDLRVQAAVSRASGTTAATVGATAALEACSGAVARAFAAADVSGGTFARAALTPACLSFIGRTIIRRGEAVLAIDAGAMRLVPSSSWDVQGEVDESSWTYRANLSAPSAVVTRSYPGDGIVHVRYSVDPERPWCGIGPLQAAALAGRLSANVSKALADESGTTTGYVLPLPVDGEDPTVAALKTDLRTSDGGLHLVESVKTMHVGAPGSAPAADWKAQRLGPNPPAGEVSLLDSAFREVCAAVGVPVAMFTDSDGTGQRESFRRFLHLCVAPLGRIVEAELSAKLDGDVTLSFDRLFAGDLSGRARAFQSLVGGGMDPAKAAALAGLMESE